MAWTQANVDALRKAIALGARTVEYDGRRVSYGSLTEMLRLLALMEFELGLTTGGRRRTLSRYWKGI